MKKLLLLLFFVQTSLSFCQEKLTEMEIKYKDLESEADKDTIIQGRVNRGVKPEDTNTFLIEYNFKTGVYTRNLVDLKVNTPVVFRITNINRLAYDVKVTPRDSILADTGWEDGVLEFLKESALPTSDDAKQKENKAALELTTKVTSLNNEDIKSTASETDKKNLIKSLNDILYIINSRTYDVKNEIKVNNNNIKIINSNLKILDSLNKANDEEIKTISDKIKKLKSDKDGIENANLDASEKTSQQEKITQEINKAQIILDSLNTIKSNIKKDIELKNKELKDKEEEKTTLEHRLNDIDKISKNIQDDYKKLNTDYDTFISTFADLKSIYFKILAINDCYNNVRLYMSDPLLSLDTINKNIKKIEELKSIFPSIRDNYQDFIGKYIQLGHEYYMVSQNEKFLQLDFGGQSKFIEPAKNMKTLADGWNEELKKTDVIALIHEMNRAFELLNAPDAFTYTSKPIQPVKDVVIFDIKIKKNNQDKPDYNNNREFSYKEYTRGGMRFDAGIGFALSYFDDASQYEIAPDNEGKDEITLKEKNIWVPSFLGMFTASFRSNKLAAFGISAGLGVSANDGKLQLNNFYVGPSLTLGRENRICFATGVTVKGMNELKKGVAVGTEVSNTNEISSFTNSVYNFGPFVSITYNLTKGIRNNVKYFYKKP